MALKLIDSDGLKQDEAFKIILSESIFYRKVKIEYYEYFLENSKKLNNLINTELKRLNNI